MKDKITWALYNFFDYEKERLKGEDVTVMYIRNKDKCIMTYKNDGNLLKVLLNPELPLEELYYRKKGDTEFTEIFDDTALPNVFQNIVTEYMDKRTGVNEFKQNVLKAKKEIAYEK